MTNYKAALLAMASWIENKNPFSYFTIQNYLLCWVEMKKWVVKPYRQRAKKLVESESKKSLFYTGTNISQYSFWPSHEMCNKGQCFQIFLVEINKRIWQNAKNDYIFGPKYLTLNKLWPDLVAPEFMRFSFTYLHRLFEEPQNM